MEEQQDLMNRPFLLASDIDGTILGDDLGEIFFRLFREKNASNFFLAYITGRSLESARELIDSKRLPVPDFIGTSVGTELNAWNDLSGSLRAKFVERVSSDWDLEVIYKLGEGPGITVQEFANGQPEFQAGFYWDGQKESLELLKQRLSGIKECLILPSSGAYIDVIPDSLGKGNAARFLQRELRLEKRDVVIAGDTGNDAEMFRTEFKGIMPVNSLAELKEIMDEELHYLSAFPAARGLLDGLKYMGFISESDLPFV